MSLYHRLLPKCDRQYLQKECRRIDAHLLLLQLILLLILLSVGLSARTTFGLDAQSAALHALLELLDALIRPLIARAREDLRLRGIVHSTALKMTSHHVGGVHRFVGAGENHLVYATMIRS